MTRFLSNSFCNFFQIYTVFCVLVFFHSQTKSESKVLESVDALHKSLIKISNKTIKRRDLALLDDVVKNSYDLEKMGKMIIGVDWKQIETKLKEDFINVFKRFISENYFRRFNRINDLDYEYQTVRVIGDKFRLAGVILIADNERIRIDYLLALKNDQWKIFDVLLDGSISEIATKKSDFKKIINEEGVRGLVKNLRERNQF